MSDAETLDGLVADLRNGLPCAESGNKCRDMSECAGCHCAMTADAITALRTEVARLTAERDEAYGRSSALVADYLRSPHSTAKSECDARARDFLAGDGDPWISALEARAERAEAALAAAMAGVVKVKPLVWKWIGENHSFGIGAGHSYEILLCSLEGKFGSPKRWRGRNLGYRHGTMEHLGYEWFNTADEAQAARQGEHEALILPDIQPDPDALAAAVGAAVEACAEAVDYCGDSAVTEALGQRLCCSGQMCGCQGADVGARIVHEIRATAPEAIHAHRQAVERATAPLRAALVDMGINPDSVLAAAKEVE